MRDQARALELVEQIYQAAVAPDAWSDFLGALSAELGGAAVQLSLRLPGEQPSPFDYHSVGLDESYRPVFLKLALDGLPWGSFDDGVLRQRFASADEAVDVAELEETSLYLDFMRPQGLAPEWPIAHLIAMHEHRPTGGIVIYPREGGRRIEPDDMTLLDSLVPHFARAYAIHRELRQSRQRADALLRTLNRLPTGVVLLDAGGRVVLTNRSADDIIALDDGFSIERGKPTVADPRRHRTLQASIERGLEQQPRPGEPVGEVLVVPRPSRRRGFSVLLSPLLSGGDDDDARAILFIADPEGGQIGTTEVLQSLYDLTHAEAELVRLIAEGHSLDRIATARDVTMNTVRSQLKQVFSKTDTRRQGELVHVVLAGVARIRDDRTAGDRES